MSGKISSDLLRGHTDTIVLKILMGCDSYGYEIYKKILEKSEGLYELKEATLYSSFRRLEEEANIICGEAKGKLKLDTSRIRAVHPALILFDKTQPKN